MPGLKKYAVYTEGRRIEEVRTRIDAREQESYRIYLDSLEASDEDKPNHVAAMQAIDVKVAVLVEERDRLQAEIDKANKNAEPSA